MGLLFYKIKGFFVLFLILLTISLVELAAFLSSRSPLFFLFFPTKEGLIPVYSLFIELLFFLKFKGLSNLGKLLQQKKQATTDRCYLLFYFNLNHYPLL